MIATGWKHVEVKVFFLDQLKILLHGQAEKKQMYLESTAADGWRFQGQAV